MRTDLNILSIGYGRHLLDPTNAERHRMELCAATVARYHMIVFTRAHEGFMQAIGGNGLIIHPTNSHSKIGMLFDAIRIGKKILQVRQNNWVITSQDPFEAGLVGYILSRKTSIPLNVQEHGDVFSRNEWRTEKFFNRIRYFFGKWLLQRAQTVRVVSDRIVKTMQQIGVKKERILKLPVRSDVIFDTPTSATGLRAQFSNSAIIVLTMGRLEDQKNLPLLIRAFKRVYDINSDAHLVIVGRGSKEHELKKLVQSLSLIKHVTFLPWTDDPVAVMREADIYALSSNYEGWARVLIEAMTAGLPVVTTDVGCAHEVLKDGIHGRVVPVGDEDAFAEALLHLSSDKSLRAQLGAAAQRDVSTVHVQPESYAEAWKNVLVATAAYNS